MTDGYRVMFAYPNTDFFANLKVEQSNAADYDKNKEVVILDLKSTIAGTEDVDSPTPVKISLNGFTGYGLTRKKIRTGGVLEMYLLFSDWKRAIITIYFLNQRPEASSFNTIGEYRKLRDRFLNDYTGCVNNNFHGSDREGSEWSRQ
jgi:hypothetical protein